MNDKEIIEIFERIWHADIINKVEPLYSTAISVAEVWAPSYADGASVNPVLRKILFQRLLNHWEDLLTGHIEHHPVPMPLGNGVSTLFGNLRERYKDSVVLTKIVNKIIRNITGVGYDQPKGEIHIHNSKAKILPDPSCLHVHN